MTYRGDVEKIATFRRLAHLDGPAICNGPKHDRSIRAFMILGAAAAYDDATSTHGVVGEIGHFHLDEQDHLALTVHKTNTVNLNGGAIVLNLHSLLQQKDRKANPECGLRKKHVSFREHLQGAAMTDEKTPLLTWQMADWRIADGVADELSDLQKAPWTINVTEGGYGGLFIEATAPDGSRRLEINMGNLHAAVGGDADELHATIQIGKDETRAVAMHPQPGTAVDGARFTPERGFEATSGDIENGFTDPNTGRAPA